MSVLFTSLFFLLTLPVFVCTSVVKSLMKVGVVSPLNKDIKYWKTVIAGILRFVVDCIYHFHIIIFCCTVLCGSNVSYMSYHETCTGDKSIWLRFITSWKIWSLGWQNMSIELKDLLIWNQRYINYYLWYQYVLFITIDLRKWLSYILFSQSCLLW